MQFADGKGRTWDLKINAFTAGKVLDDIGIDLTTALDKDSTVIKELASPIKTVQVLWSLIENQATEKNVTPEDFGESMQGEQILAASDCLWRAIADFFPEPAKSVLLNLIEATNKMQQQVTEKLAKVPEGGFTTALDKEMESFDRALERLQSGETSTTSQE